MLLAATRLVYCCACDGVTAIVVLSVKTPPNGTSFLDHWPVPLPVGVVAALGLAYLLVVRPKEQISEEDRVEVDGQAAESAVTA